MYDLVHEWGNDIAIASNGDLALVTGSALIGQRICRRLLTNPGGYLWHLEFGGGLAQLVGAPANTAAIEGIVRSQLTLDASIPTNPIPAVDARVSDVASGLVSLRITYSDPSSTLPTQLNINLG